MLISARPSFKAFATNQNSAAFTAKVAKFGRPSGNGILDLTADGEGIPSCLRINPYGLGADNDVFSFRVWGWAKLGGGGPPNEMYIPSIIAEVVCTLSTSVGVATGPILDTERFADTLAPVALLLPDYKIAAGTSLQGCARFMTPANNTPAWFIIPIDGWKLLEFDTDQTTGTPTANALCTWVEDCE